MHLLKNNLLILTMLCLVTISCSKDDSVTENVASYDIDLTLTHKNNRAISSQILDLINEHRATLGLASLIMDSEYACAYAVEHTEYMIEKERINHDHFGYRSEGVKYHADAKTVGENVAYGYESAEKAVEAWLKSPEHRAIIEGDYTHTGFGVLKCEKDRNYFTQLFYKK